MSKKIRSVWKILFIVFVLLFSSCKEDTIQPELNGSISGLVIDQNTSAILTGASITTNPPTSAILTDSDGKFKIENIPVGNYIVSAQKSGYKNGSVSVSVRENTNTQATISMEIKNTINSAPNAPQNPFPSNMAKDQPTTINLSWSGSDPDADSLSYTVFLYKSGSSNQEIIASGIRDTNITVTNLDYNTTYFWQVAAKDTSVETNSITWNFTTRGYPNNPYIFSRKVDAGYEIFSSDTTEINTIQLTKNNGNNTWSRFNPSKNKIAYISDVSLDRQIFTMNIDGTDNKKITTVSVAGYGNFGIGFSWAPDGGSLIYGHYEKLYKINSDGSNLKQIAAAPLNRHFRECEFSSLGDKIVTLTVGTNIYDSEIYVMNSDGTSMQLVVDNLPGMTGSPSFSLDGKSILYTNDISGLESPDGKQLNSHIFIKNLSDSTVKDISDGKPNGTNDANPRFSPDGGLIIFNNSLSDGSTPSDIWIMDLDGNNRKKIITNGLMPDWKN